MPSVQATKALQKRADAALDAFHKYYAGIWGEERWNERLYPALTQATRHVAVINTLAGPQFTESVSAQLPGSTVLLGNQIVSKLQYPLVISNVDDKFPQPTKAPTTDGSSLMNFWLMDFASVIAATALQVESGNTVLDLCAAPGGKSVVLSQMLLSSMSDSMTGCLHSNEDDHTRNKRLAGNLQAYIPAHHFETGTVKVLKLDGTSKNALTDLPSAKQGYDRILVDAPCSSERHIIQAHVKASSSRQIAPEISNWKASHSKTLAKTQSGLLMTAFKALKVGGRLVYATCSISNEENDDVVERTLEAVKREEKKAKGQMKWEMQIVESHDAALGKLLGIAEKTKYGWIVLPDMGKPDLWGPLYFAIMTKVSLEDVDLASAVMETKSKIAT